LEERIGERRSSTILNAAAGGAIPAGRRTDISGALAENDDLLSLALSSKGGEENGAAAGQQQVRVKSNGGPTAGLTINRRPSTIPRV
jgi:hypothetical protein